MSTADRRVKLSSTTLQMSVWSNSLRIAFQPSTRCFVRRFNKILHYLRSGFTAITDLVCSYFISLSASVSVRDKARLKSQSVISEFRSSTVQVSETKMILKIALLIITVGSFEVLARNPKMIIFNVGTLVMTFQISPRSLN